MWMVFEQFTDRAAQRAGAMAVDDAYFAQTFQERLVEKFVHRVDSFIGSFSDDVQLRACGLIRRGWFEFSATRDPELHSPSALGWRPRGFYEFKILELLAKAQRFHS